MFDDYERSLRRERNKEREAVAERIKKRRELEEVGEKKKKEVEREAAIKSPVKKEWPLFFITHIDNLSSILERGILSPALVKKLKIKYTPIYSEKIVGKRKYKMACGKILSEFAHVYFNPRNAFLYQVLSERTSRKIIVIESTLNVSNDGICIADRNAAKDDVSFMDSYNYYKIIPKIVKETGEWQQGRRWQSGKAWAVDDSKGKIMAECLVPDKIPPEHFKFIHVYTHDVKAEIIPKLYEQPHLDIIVNPFMFFSG